MDIPPPGTVMYLAPVIYILAAAGIYGCISAQVQYYLPPEMAEKHWGITGKSQRVFSVPGV